MNNQEINIAIAEWRGWKPCPKIGCNEHWTSPTGVTMKQPNFCEDLNAMHEAEGKLNETQVQAYLNRLADCTPVKSQNRYGYWPMVHATAPQRAEALMRTIGKWRD